MPAPRDFAHAAEEFFSTLDSEIPALLGELREGLGTSAMPLEEMVQEMRRIRETSDYVKSVKPGEKT